MDSWVKLINGTEMPLLCQRVSPGERNCREKVVIYAKQESHYFVAFCLPSGLKLDELPQHSVLCWMGGRFCLENQEQIRNHCLSRRNCMLSDRVGVKNSDHRGKEKGKEVPHILRDSIFISWNYLSIFLRDLKIPQ
jgi:hypothetical protein